MRRLPLPTIAVLLSLLVLLVGCGSGEGGREPGEPVGGAGGEGEAQEVASAGGRRSTAEPVLDEKWYRDSDGNHVPGFMSWRTASTLKWTIARPRSVPARRRAWTSTRSRGTRS